MLPGSSARRLSAVSRRMAGWRCIKNLALSPLGVMRGNDYRSESRVEDRDGSGWRTVQAVKCQAIPPDWGAALDHHQRRPWDCRHRGQWLVGCDRAIDSDGVENDFRHGTPL